MRRTGDDGMEEPLEDGWQSAPFESAVGKLGGVSRQTGLLG